VGGVDQIFNDGINWRHVNCPSDTPPVPQQASVSLGSFTGVLALFDKAKSHLKFPKVRLNVAGNTVVLSVAGAKSKYPGYVNIAESGLYGARKWYGRISPSGEWQKTNEVSPQLEVELTDALTQLSENPSDTAAHYGKLTGSCCFCNLTLTDARSVAAGYGPICAGHYGLSEQWANAVKPRPLNATIPDETFAEFHNIKSA
jgi:hypothetical protein